MNTNNAGSTDAAAQDPNAQAAAEGAASTSAQTADNQAAAEGAGGESEEGKQGQEGAAPASGDTQDTKASGDTQDNPQNQDTQDTPAKKEDEPGKEPEKTDEPKKDEKPAAVSPFKNEGERQLLEAVREGKDTAGILRLMSVDPAAVPVKELLQAACRKAGFDPEADFDDWLDDNFPGYDPDAEPSTYEAKKAKKAAMELVEQERSAIAAEKAVLLGAPADGTPAPTQEETAAAAATNGQQEQQANEPTAEQYAEAERLLLAEAQTWAADTTAHVVQVDGFEISLTPQDLYGEIKLDPYVNREQVVLDAFFSSKEGIKRLARLMHLEQNLDNIIAGAARQGRELERLAATDRLNESMPTNRNGAVVTQNAQKEMTDQQELAAAIKESQRQEREARRAQVRR